MTVVVLCPIRVELILLIQVLSVRHHVEVQLNHLPVLQKNGELERPQLVALPSGLLTPHATPLFFSMNDCVEICAHSSQNDGVLDPSVSAAIQSAVCESMGSLVDNLTQVIESRPSDFAKQFSEENSSSVEQAVKRVRREHCTCERKGNQQQLDHSLQVLDKLNEASYEKVKVALESGAELVSKRVKAIKLADKSKFGWVTVNEYLFSARSFLVFLLCYSIRCFGYTIHINCVHI